MHVRGAVHQTVGDDLTTGQLAALTLWYMAVSDTFKKKD